MKTYKFIKYSNNLTGEKIFINKLIEYFKSVGVDSISLEFIQTQLESPAKEHTVHSTVESVARKYFTDQIYKNPFLMEFVVRMFYWDFRLFNYSIPEINFLF